MSVLQKVKRKIIKIDEEKCNGCGECIPGCPEQAIQIIETPEGPKARLVKEFYCDGLGACLGSCPTGALTIEEKDAEPYNEEETIARIKEVAPEMLGTHLKHLKEHSHELPEHHSHKGLSGGCPSARAMQWEKESGVDSLGSLKNEAKASTPSELHQWPIQLHLVSPSAPYFQDADLVVVADCVPFAYADFHQDFLKGKAIVIGCPKLDDVEAYVEKITEILKEANPKSIKVIHMEVPCCAGLDYIVRRALSVAKKKIPVENIVISIKGDKI